ncbi:MAG TPA: NAD-dependent deacylase [bacterium]|nr:NAD-dependent deacylase [bacterium]
MVVTYQSPGFNRGVKTLAQFMRESAQTVLLTGAGMDTQSNIPDFRSKSGWWRKLDPSTVASVATLERNYPLFHQFYSMRIKMLENVEPHPGHRILAQLEQEGVIKSIATQNVSGLHRQAGSKAVYELHGNIKAIRCNHCNSDACLEDFLNQRNCCVCGENMLRPNVVLFGELLPQTAWQAAQQDIEHSDLLIVIGTSLKVGPVNQFPLLAPGKAVLINNEDVGSSRDFQLKLIGPAQEILEELGHLLTRLS